MVIEARERYYFTVEGTTYRSRPATRHLSSYSEPAPHQQGEEDA
jgi:hypothetical protein